MRNVAEFNKTYKDLLHNLMPADVKPVFVDHGLINIFTNRDQKGRRLMVVHMGEKWNTKEVTEDQIFRALYTIQKLAVLEPATQINGAVVIYDFKGMGMGHVKAMSTSGAKRLLTFIQEACPLRMKAVHFVNEPMIFNMVWSLFKPFVKEKLNKRVSRKLLVCRNLGDILQMGFWVCSRCQFVDVLPRREDGQAARAHLEGVPAGKLWWIASGPGLWWQGVVPGGRAVQ